jgi:hypothetical protein
MIPLKLVDNTSLWMDFEFNENLLLLFPKDMNSRGANGFANFAPAFFFEREEAYFLE